MAACMDVCNQAWSVRVDGARCVLRCKNNPKDAWAPSTNCRGLLQGIPVLIKHLDVRRALGETTFIFGDGHWPPCTAQRVGETLFCFFFFSRKGGEPMLFYA